jgi:hypothetical protein
MVLDEQGAPGNAGRLAKEEDRIVGVMEDVDDRQRVEDVVRKREPSAVVERDGDGGRASGMDVDAGNRDVRAAAKKLSREQTVSGTHVQDRRSLRKETSEVSGEDPDSAADDVIPMKVLDRAQRRFIPSTLMKKLERIV